MRPYWKRVLTEGLVAGLIGYAVIAVVMALLDVLQGRPAFYTAALLGSAAFYGLDDPAELVVWVGPVLAYNGVHLLVFLALGVVTAWLAAVAERGQQFWYLALSVFLFIFIHLYAAVLWFAHILQHALAWWTVGLASLAAAAAMVTYLWRAHPRLRRRLDEYRDVGHGL